MRPLTPAEGRRRIRAEGIAQLETGGDFPHLIISETFP